MRVPVVASLLALAACGLNPAFKSTGTAGASSDSSSDDGNTTTTPTSTAPASTSTATATSDVSTSSSTSATSTTSSEPAATTTGTDETAVLADTSSDTGNSADRTCPKDQALVVCYTFDEGDGNTLVDRTGDGPDGTLKNVTYTTSYDPSYGTAVQLAPISVIDVPNEAPLSPEQFTVAMLAYTVPAPGVQQFLVDKSQQFAVFQQDTTLRCTVRTKDGGMVTAISAVKLDAWHFIACTYDGVSLALLSHADGQDLTSSSQLAGVLGPPVDEPMAIGRDVPEDDKKMLGRIDHFLFYDRALADQEVCILAGDLC